jgi:hypothetical protein
MFFLAIGLNRFKLFVSIKKNKSGAKIMK